MKTSDALTTPIVQTSTYTFRDSAELIAFQARRRPVGGAAASQACLTHASGGGGGAARRQEGKHTSFEYGRYGNPTTRAAEQKIMCAPQALRFACAPAARATAALTRPPSRATDWRCVSPRAPRHPPPPAPSAAPPRARGSRHCTHLDDRCTRARAAGVDAARAHARCRRAGRWSAPRTACCPRPACAQPRQCCSRSCRRAATSSPRLTATGARASSSRPCCRKWVSRCATGRADRGPPPRCRRRRAAAADACLTARRPVCADDGDRPVRHGRAAEGAGHAQGVALLLRVTHEPVPALRGRAPRL